MVNNCDHNQRKKMQDVCLSSTRVALEFYHAARDSLLLYEAVIPVKVSAWKQLHENKCSSAWDVSLVLYLFQYNQILANHEIFTTPFGDSPLQILDEARYFVMFQSWPLFIHLWLMVISSFPYEARKAAW